MGMARMIAINGNSIIMSRRVSWNEWPKIRDLLGLRVVEVRMEDNAETTIVVDGPREALASLDSNLYRPRNGKTLAKVLADLLNQVEKAPGQPKRASLHGGLRIDAIRGIDNIMRLQISRKKVYPSPKEWETVLKHLPAGLAGRQDPERFEVQGYFYLRSEIN